MPNTGKQKDKESSEIEDLKELAQFREKTKIQNEALKKIVDKLNSPKEDEITSK